VKRSDIEAMVQRYVEAEMAVLDGKSITFNGQQMSYENLSEIRRGGRSGSGGLPTVTGKAWGDPAINWRGLDDVSTG
jgi:hypothetical protein